MNDECIAQCFVCGDPIAIDDPCGTDGNRAACVCCFADRARNGLMRQADGWHFEPYGLNAPNGTEDRSSQL